MRETILAIVVVAGFFVLRGILATVFFFYLLPEGVNCPNCDAATLRLEGRRMRLLMPRFRKSWCIECGWDGLLRETGDAHDPAWTLSQSGQLPLSSKKSSK